MIVLQINTVYGEKSTGRNCAEIESALIQAGHACYTAYGNGHSNNPLTYRIGSTIEYYFHNIMARITGLQGYFSYFATKRLIRYINEINPDIIHLHNLHANYINLPLIFKFLKNFNKPVIVNLHDCWAFTGKCAHYTDRNCIKWKSECRNCPVLKQYPQSLFFDFTKKMRRDKEKWFTGIKNLTVIGVSDWVVEQAKQSFFKKYPIFRVYNWVDMDTFKPYSENARKKYGISISKFIIIGVSANWNPNSRRYKDFMKLAELIDGNKMEIVMVGRSIDSIKHPNITHIPFTSDTKELAKLYSSSDVYVHLSTEDTFGKVVAEAMSCGTPAIVYDATALPELILERCGYVAETGNIYDVYELVLKVMKHGKSFYSSSCLGNVDTNFNYKINTGKLIAIYESLLSKTITNTI